MFAPSLPWASSECQGESDQRRIRRAGTGSFRSAPRPVHYTALVPSTATPLPEGPDRVCGSRKPSLRHGRTAPLPARAIPGAACPSEAAPPPHRACSCPAVSRAWSRRTNCSARWVAVAASAPGREGQGRRPHRVGTGPASPRRARPGPAAVLPGRPGPMGWKARRATAGPCCPQRSHPPFVGTGAGRMLLLRGRARHKPSRTRYRRGCASGARSAATPRNGLP